MSIEIRKSDILFAIVINYCFLLIMTFLYSSLELNIFDIVLISTTLFIIGLIGLLYSKHKPIKGTLKRFICIVFVILLLASVSSIPIITILLFSTITDNVVVLLTIGDWGYILTSALLILVKLFLDNLNK